MTDKQYSYGRLTSELGDIVMEFYDTHKDTIGSMVTAGYSYMGPARERYKEWSTARKVYRVLEKMKLNKRIARPLDYVNPENLIGENDSPFIYICLEDSPKDKKTLPQEFKGYKVIYSVIGRMTLY